MQHFEKREEQVNTSGNKPVQEKLYFYQREYRKWCKERWCIIFFQVIRACVLAPYFSLNFLWLLLWKKLLIFGSRISLLSPNITSFMFSQVTALLPSGLCYLGHLQHSVRALCLISVALVTHLLSQMPLTYKDSLSHPIFHGCMAYTSDWILFDLHKPFALL